MKTGDLLRSDESRYGLIYGIARLVDANPHHYGKEDPLFCTVNDNNGISALSWRTPPYPVGLAWRAGDPEEAVSLLIEAIHSRWAEMPGVTGHREVTVPFAGRWCKNFGTSIKSTMAQRIYRLDSVNNVTSVPGSMRLATLASISHLNPRASSSALMYSASSASWPTTEFMRIMSSRSLTV